MSESCSVMSDSLRRHGLYSPWDSGQNTGVGSLSLLQGIFPTQGSNPGLSHCRWILYQLSHKGSPIMGKGLLNNYPRNKKRQQGAKLKGRREKGHLPLLAHIQLLKNKTKQKTNQANNALIRLYPLLSEDHPWRRESIS